MLLKPIFYALKKSQRSQTLTSSTYHYDRKISSVYNDKPLCILRWTTHCLRAINKPPPTGFHIYTRALFLNLNLICRYRVLRQLKNYDTFISNKLRPLFWGAWAHVSVKLVVLDKTSSVQFMWNRFNHWGF